MQKLQTAIEQYYASGPLAGEALAQAKAFFQELREALTCGEVRSAEKIDGQWRANAWVKQGILLGFRLGELVESGGNGSRSCVDESTYPARQFNVADRMR